MTLKRLAYDVSVSLILPVANNFLNNHYGVTQTAHGIKSLIIIMYQPHEHRGLVNSVSVKIFEIHPPHLPHIFWAKVVSPILMEKDLGRM